MELASAARHIDEIRASAVAETAGTTAIERLRAFTGAGVAPEQLVAPARSKVAESSRELERLQALERVWSTADAQRERLSALDESVATAERTRIAATEELARLSIPDSLGSGSETLASRARDLSSLVEVGRKLGLIDGHCPLCATKQTENDFRSRSCNVRVDR